MLEEYSWLGAQALDDELDSSIEIICNFNESNQVNVVTPDMENFFMDTKTKIPEQVVRV